jgi:hypothetical protein
MEEKVLRNRKFTVVMSANPLELFSVHGSLNKGVEGASPHVSERRLRARTRLHWPLLLFRNLRGEAIESITHDLSSGGFYCLAPIAFRIGEALTCSMKIPTHDPNGKRLERNLECRVRVVRVKPESEGQFGVACQIEDYHFAEGIDSR